MSSIKDIRVFNHQQEWDTKSGGTLRVLYALDYSIARDFLSFHEATDTNHADIRGIRSYVVHDIPKGKIGANEWHKIRNEIITVLNGSIKWTCTDTEGNEAQFVINKGTAVFTPNHILHRYESLEEHTALTVLANTIFQPGDPTTHDTYPAETFPALQTSKLDDILVL